MSSVISKIKTLWSRLADREYREAFLDEAINSRLAAQIYALRISRGLTQAEVSVLTGIAQPTLSRLESDAYGITTTTLKRIAKAYDVALSVRFFGFNEFADDVAAGKIDRVIPSFADSPVPAALAISAKVSSVSGAASPDGKVNFESRSASPPTLIKSGLSTTAIH